MALRILEGQVTAILIDEWYKVQLDTFRINKLELMTSDAQTPGPILQWGFVFTPSGNDNTVVTGPLDSIRAYKLAKA